MKFKKFGVLIGLLALIIVLAGCQSQEDKEKEFKKQTNIYIEKLSKTVDKVDQTSANDLKDYKKIVSATDKTNTEIKADYKKYKESFDKDALDNKDNKKVFDTITNITDIYTQSYDNIHKIGDAQGVDEKSFSKHALNEFTNAYAALANQSDNLKKEKADKILNEKAYKSLETTIERSSNELETVVKGYAILQGHDFNLPKKDLPTFDAVKFGKYHLDGENKTVTADKYNQLADKANKVLDKDSQVPHVSQSVNEFSYDLLSDKYEYVKAVKDLMDSMGDTDEDAE